MTDTAQATPAEQVVCAQCSKSLHSLCFHSVCLPLVLASTRLATGPHLLEVHHMICEVASCSALAQAFNYASCDSPPSIGAANAQRVLLFQEGNRQQLQRLAYLLLCSDQCVQRMAQKCPEVLQMDPADVTERLMLLKVVFCPHICLVDDAMVMSWCAAKLCGRLLPMLKCMQQSRCCLGSAIWAWDAGRVSVLQPTLTSELTWSLK